MDLFGASTEVHIDLSSEHEVGVIFRRWYVIHEANITDWGLTYG
jgi:hypothetical protein